MVYHKGEMSGKERPRVSRRGKPASPRSEWNAWLKEGNEERKRALAEGRLGRRKRLHTVLEEQFGQVRTPKEIRKAAEGLMDGFMLSIWWVTPNNYLWLKSAEGDDISRDFLDATGRTTVTPMMMWVWGQKEEVIDLIMAMKDDPYEQVDRVIEALKKKNRKR